MCPLVVVWFEVVATWNTYANLLPQSDFLPVLRPYVKPEIFYFLARGCYSFFTYMIKTFPKALMELFHGTSQPMPALSHYESIELDVAT